MTLNLSTVALALLLAPGQLREEARALVEVQPGVPYDPATVRRSIKQLFALGSFSDIKVDARPVGDGVSLTFHLYPQVTVGEVRAVQAAGSATEVPPLRELILREAAIHPGEPFDATRVEAAGVAIETWLNRRGFLWARGEPQALFFSSPAHVIFYF